MFRISKDSPAFYLTSVAKDRLPVFQKPKIRDLVCKAIDEARGSANFLLFAYVVMLDHLDLIVGSELKPSKVAQFVNGIVGRRVIDFLKANSFESSLRKLEHAGGSRGYKYSLWDHHPNIKLLSTENVFIEKVNYIHQNPVRAGLVSQAEDHRWSSVRYWLRKPLENEPLVIDIDQIVLRSR